MKRNAHIPNKKVQDIEKDKVDQRNNVYKLQSIKWLLIHLFKFNFRNLDKLQSITIDL